MLKQIHRDIEVIFERDPAVRSVLEALLSYPGLHAIWAHRLTHRLYRCGFVGLARILSQIARFFTQVEIHPGAVLGEGLFIDHGCGIVIGETAILGKNVTLYQGVTLGGTGKETGKRHPTLGDQVMVSSGAKVLGNITIGNYAKIGAGSVVLKDVPDGATVVGIPGKVVRQHGEPLHPSEHDVDLEHGHLPDPVGDALMSIRDDLASIKRRLKELEENENHE